MNLTVSVPVVVPPAALPLARRPSSLAQEWIQAGPLGPILRSEYSRDSPERGSMTALATQRGGGERRRVAKSVDEARV